MLRNLNSISSLERWQLWLGCIAVIGGLFAIWYGTIGGLVAAFASGGGLWIGHRISTLMTRRTFTPEQRVAIADNLKGKLPAPFVMKAYTPSSDSIQYASQLEKVLVDAGWGCQVSDTFIVTGGDSPPTGITIIVDGDRADTITIGKQLVEALTAAQVEDVKFEIDKNVVNLASTWVLLKVGPKGNH